MQVYTRPKEYLFGSSLAFTLKEGPVRCAKVCNKSWVILMHITVGRLKEKNVKTESLAGRNCVICVHLREEDLQSHYK